MNFAKYHALGNDYIIIPPENEEKDPTAPNSETIKRLCHRHYGLGSDGILYGPLEPDSAIGKALRKRAIENRRLNAATKYVCGLRIFNPDGSEAEKSGNGLRIFCRYLYDTGVVGSETFTLLTLGGDVTCTILNNGHTVRVEMGTVSFAADQVPVTGYKGDVVDRLIEVEGEKYRFNAATIGNPHCIILMDEISPDAVCRIGPGLERHPAFPNRANVQIMRVRDKQNLEIEIWERGAGYTLASGSSASACAATARRLGLCEKHVTVHMPGGKLKIDIADDYQIMMQGAVTGVARGQFLPDLFI